MRRHGIRAPAGRRFRPCTTGSRHDPPIAPNLPRQAFPASGPDMAWPADVACLPTREGWLRLAAILDPAARKVAGWSMREHMRTEPTTAALMMPVRRRRPGPGLVHHSDRGSQHAAQACRKRPAGMKAVPSTSRTACCYDNAPSAFGRSHGVMSAQLTGESFFHALKVDLVHRRRWAARDEARRDLSAAIEGCDNRQRLHPALGYITPEQAERKTS